MPATFCLADIIQRTEIISTTILADFFWLRAWVWDVWKYVLLQLRKDFEDDKQSAMSHALAQAQRDVENARRQTEERCKDDLADEVKKLVQKHKTEISATKKKQWVRRELRWWWRRYIETPLHHNQSKGGLHQPHCVCVCNSAITARKRRCTTAVGTRATAQ